MIVYTCMQKGLLLSAADNLEAVLDVARDVFMFLLGVAALLLQVVELSTVFVAKVAQESLLLLLQFGGIFGLQLGQLPACFVLHDGLLLL